MKRILDASFRYTPSYGTDIRRTFERIRREQDPQRNAGAASAQQAGEKVLRLDSRKAGNK
jgi:hypothetical protein